MIKKISSLENLVPSPYPDEIYPELAVLVDRPPEGDEWLHEIKFDGYRLLAFKNNRSTHMITRNQNDWTDQFHKIAKLISALPVSKAVFDGEVVILDEHMHSNFQLLQNSMKENKYGDFIYYIFDLIYYDKYDISDLPLLERKLLLKKILAKNKNHILRFSEHITGSGALVFKKACQEGLEGIVSKKANSPYVERRNSNWLKIKCVQRQEFIILGYTQPQGSRQFFGSLILGTYNKAKELQYHGLVGTGFNSKSLKNVYQQLIKYKTPKSPFKRKIPGESRITWVKPVLVAEVEFRQWTEDEILRAPSFKGLRADKNPKDIILERTKSLKKVLKKE